MARKDPARVIRIGGPFQLTLRKITELTDSTAKECHHPHVEPTQQRKDRELGCYRDSDCRNEPAGASLPRLVRRDRGGEGAVTEPLAGIIGHDIGGPHKPKDEDNEPEDSKRRFIGDVRLSKQYQSAKEARRINDTSKGRAHACQEAILRNPKRSYNKVHDRAKQDHRPNRRGRHGRDDEGPEEETASYARFCARHLSHSIKLHLPHKPNERYRHRKTRTSRIGKSNSNRSPDKGR